MSGFRVAVPPIVLSSLLLFWTAGFVSAQQLLYVAPQGDDTGRCEQAQPCASFQRAIDLCPAGGHCRILPAPGVYRQFSNLFYYKTVEIRGPLNSGDNCADRSNVVVEADSSKGSGPPLFWVQDHATLILWCLTLRSSVPGTIGMQTRQFAIGDAFDVNFGAFPGGLGAQALETSKINIVAPGIQGSAYEFASATDLSQLVIAGRIEMANDLVFDIALIGSVAGSIVSVLDPIDGGARMTGASYLCDGAVIRKTAVLPGGDKRYEGGGACSLSGAGFEKAPNPYLVQEKLTALRTETTAMRDELQAAIGRAEANLRAQQRRDRNYIAIIGSTAAVFLLLLGCWGFYRVTTALRKVSRSPAGD